jgi:hypothetical protein
VFDISQKSYNWWAPAFGLIFLLFGISFIRRPPERTRTFGWIFIAFSLIWITLVLITTGSAYLRAVQAYREGSYQVIEGVVHEFVPMPYTGHALESFRVNGKIFRYSDYVETPGFNKTRSHGGPIHEGLPVRIGYLGNTILKLEIARNADKGVDHGLPAEN